LKGCNDKEQCEGGVDNGARHESVDQAGERLAADERADRERDWDRRQEQERRREQVDQEKQEDLRPERPDLTQDPTRQTLTVRLAHDSSGRRPIASRAAATPVAHS
jgi:hypothetical protein